MSQKTRPVRKPGLHPGKCRISLLAGWREDLKVLWEAVRTVEVFYSEPWYAFFSGEVFIEKEEGWGRLEQVLDMSEDQFKAEAQDVEESEEEEEEEEEEVMGEEEEEEQLE